MTQPSATFIDLFAGCGGLSLGLLSAGLTGVVAVERDPQAFESLRSNLIDSRRSIGFAWPTWLPKAPIGMEEFVTRFGGPISELQGSITLIAGGPPCQGYSAAGRRNYYDRRNRLFELYLDVVGLVAPRYLLLENVQGISSKFRHLDTSGHGGRAKGLRPYSDILVESLQNIGYVPFCGIVRAVDFGVAQRRPRFFLIGVREDVAGSLPCNPFDALQSTRHAFLSEKGLVDRLPVSVGDAISDLKSDSEDLVDCEDALGFKRIRYRGPETEYQRLLHGTLNGRAPNSLRLAKHREDIRSRFEWVIRNISPGKKLSQVQLTRLGTKKHSLYLLARDQPAPTLTTLPDDIVHYADPRILTVREMARLQSFPDWFEFQGNYTTGHFRRAKQCPRFTQVGNAVPPFVGEAIGRALLELDRQHGLLTMACSAQTASMPSEVGRAGSMLANIQ